MELPNTSRLAHLFSLSASKPSPPAPEPSSPLSDYSDVSLLMGSTPGGNPYALFLPKYHTRNSGLLRTYGFTVEDSRQASDWLCLGSMFDKLPAIQW
jgi:hypothetical protein